MRAELRQSEPGVTPSFFFLDVRGADAGAFLDFLKREAPGVKISEMPMMRGRFVRIGDTPVEAVKASDDVAWALEGDRGVTFAAKTARRLRDRRRRVVARRLFRSAAGLDGEGGGGRPRPPASATRSSSTCSGRDIAAKIANLRKVNWRSFAINFVLVYSPNTLKGAPYTELVSAALPSGDGPEAELALLRAAARQFPTGRERQGARSAGKRRGAGRQARAGDSRRDRRRAATSVLVLAGALAANRRARLADATILKILGATRGRG